MSLSLSTNARHRPPDTLPAVVVNTLRCRHPAKDLAPTVPPEPVVAPPSGPRTPTTSAAPPAAAVRRPTVKPLATGDAARDRRRSAGDGRLMLVVPVDRFRMRSPADEQARWCANAWHEIYQGARGDESVQESDGASGKASPVFPHVGHMTKPRRHLNLPPWRLPCYRGCSASSSRRAGDRLARPARAAWPYWPSFDQAERRARRRDRSSASSAPARRGCLVRALSRRRGVAADPVRARPMALRLADFTMLRAPRALVWVYRQFPIQTFHSVSFPGDGGCLARANPLSYSDE